MIYYLIIKESGHKAKIYAKDIIDAKRLMVMICGLWNIPVNAVKMEKCNNANSNGNSGKE